MDEDGVLRLDVELGVGEEVSTKCIIAKVFTNRQFNAFGFLEAMKREMAPAGGFEALEIGKNLFSFQFKTEGDMRAVLAREPWHFDKNVVMIEELKSGTQPSSFELKHAAFWVRINDLPMATRNEGSVSLIAGKIGDLVEIDSPSLEGFGRSVRVKIKIDLTKPLKNGIQLELQRGQKIWINLKFERLPSFCYICGTLGHMRKECDLVEGSTLMEKLPNTKLPFRDWLRASPGKKALISMEEQKPLCEPTLIRWQLFEKFKERIVKGDGNLDEEPGRDEQASAIHRQVEDDMCAQLEMIVVKMEETHEETMEVIPVRTIQKSDRED
ncbi:hypothetical protein ACS0TY_033045 [Phlomoides rotata]